jgi:hypothetical protein
VYSYLDLNLNPSAALAKATMRFVVPQAWIAGQQIDASTVALYSYDGQWSKLPTTRVDFVEGGTVYEGIAPHLSYFAVAAEVQAPATATPTPPVVDVLVLNQDVLAGSSTAVFTMNAIPWRLQYRTSWSGKVALSARTAAGNSILLTEHQAVAGFLYETHIYGVTGTLSLSAAGGPSSGSWTVWVTANPATPRADTPWVFTYTGTALANTPQFDVASSPWLLSYETTWSGPLVLAVMGPDGPMRVVETEVTAGTTYLTHVYGVRGKVFLFAENAPPTGRWTVKVNAEPKLNNVSPPALLTYTGTGRVNSPPFTSDTPMFRLVYLATWSGPFRLVAQTSDGTRVLVDREVQAGVIYEVYVSDVTGPMYLTVVAAPPDRAWSLSVWRVEPPNQT